MKDKYPEGTICRLDKTKYDLPKDHSDYVYIKQAKLFNKYECYQCDIYGEIISFRSLIVDANDLYKRTNFPHLSDEDLVTCIKVLAAFKTLAETKEIELNIVGELANEFSILTHKITLNVLAGKLL